jgi:hypothetical protein
MRIFLSAVVCFASASVEEEVIDPTEWDLVLEVLDDDVDDPDNSPPSIISDDLLLDPRGVITSLPQECVRPVRMLSNSVYKAILQEYKESGRVTSVHESINSQRVSYRNRLYKSLHNAVRHFLSGLSVSEPALQVLLELNRSGIKITRKIFHSVYQSQIVPTDPHHSSRCDLHLWYAYVINPVVGRPFKDAQVEATTSREGFMTYRPTGSALEALIDFELSRVAEGDLLGTIKRFRED